MAWFFITVNEGPWARWIWRHWKV